MSIRCFIAIELDHPVQKQLARLQNNFRHEHTLDDPALKWLRPENIHLTVKFLGDVPDSQITAICAAVTAAAAESAPFDIQIGNCGCFPPRGAARVLWVGLAAGLDPLSTLHEKLELNLIDLGFEPETRPFSPHLTLARIKNPRIGRLVNNILPTIPAVTFPPQPVSALTVFQSQLDRTGPTYTPLHHAQLSL